MLEVFDKGASFCRIPFTRRHWVNTSSSSLICYLKAIWWHSNEGKSRTIVLFCFVFFTRKKQYFRAQKAITNSNCFDNMYLYLNQTAERKHLKAVYFQENTIAWPRVNPVAPGEGEGGGGVVGKLGYNIPLGTVKCFLEKRSDRLFKITFSFVFSTHMNWNE